MAGVGAEGEAQGVCAALGDAAGVVVLPAVLGFLHLQRIQVAVLQLVVEPLGRNGGRQMVDDREGGEKKQKALKEFFVTLIINHL